MKKLAMLSVLVIAVVLMLTPTVAFANFAIHGGYAQDTDACAGCHRAHTSVSSITWKDQLPPGLQEDHSALLVSNATQIYQFCYACHDDSGQGADTNVQSGIYDGSSYGAHNAPLNGGGFEDIGDLGVQITSTHGITGSWGAYGGGLTQAGTSTATGLDPVSFASLGTGNQIEMTCASCHDPHGSSNYRLLQDKVNGNTVGGYDGALNDNPLPWVISNEPGYPNGVFPRALGWKKHDMGAAQITAYTPNYTTPMYAKAPTETGTPNRLKGMSGWCAGCHSVYMLTGTPHDATSTYDAADGFGFVSRHRHPINIPLTQYSGTATLTPANAIPLPLASSAGAAATNTADSWIDCLACHYAHGTSAVMTGFASVKNVSDPEGEDEFGNPNFMKPNTGTIQNGSGGVPPSGSSALLRRNDRGVCEVCHNK